MRAGLAKFLWVLSQVIETISQKVCDHEYSHMIKFESHETRCCWNCWKEDMPNENTNISVKN